MRNKIIKLAEWLVENADLIEGVAMLVALSLAVYGLMFSFSAVLG